MVNDFIDVDQVTVEERVPRTMDVIPIGYSINRRKGVHEVSKVDARER